MKKLLEIGLMLIMPLLNERGQFKTADPPDPEPGDPGKDPAEPGEPPVVDPEPEPKDPEPGEPASH